MATAKKTRKKSITTASILDSKSTAKKTIHEAPPSNAELLEDLYKKGKISFEDAKEMMNKSPDEINRIHGGLIHQNNNEKVSWLIDSSFKFGRLSIKERDELFEFNKKHSEEDSLKELEKTLIAKRIKINDDLFHLFMLTAVGCVTIGAIVAFTVGNTGSRRTFRIVG